MIKIDVSQSKIFNPSFRNLFNYFFIWFTFYGGYLIGSHFDKGWYLSEDGYNFIGVRKTFQRQRT